MKKQPLILSLLLALFVWSCGGGNSSDKAENQQEDNKAKKEVYSLETEEGMLKKLKEFKVEIPPKFVLVEIKYKSAGGYTAEFIIEGMDESAKTEIFEWYQKQCADLVEDGWRKKTIYDSEEMMGSIINQDLFYMNSKSLSMSSNFDIEKNSYKLWLRPDD